MSKFDDEDLKKLLLEDPRSTNLELGKILGVDESCVSRRKHKLARKGWSPQHDMTHEVPDGFKIKGVSTYYKDGVAKGQWVKSSEDKERQLEIMKEAIKSMVKELPKVEPVTLYNEHLIQENLMAVYPLGDPHIGLLSWGKECGDDWDLAIAEKVFGQMFDRVIRTAPKCKEGVIINLGDYFHSDNMEAVTTRSGNHLDQDGRYAKMVHIGVLIIRRMISTALEHHEIIRVINCIGNHDDTSSVFLAICLKHVYENEPRVIVEDTFGAFHYVRFGKNLLGAHHGHTCKMNNLPGVMAADKAKDWGETEFRYWLTGHIHHDSKQEYPGCMVESFRTIAAKDAYATYGGWRSGRDTKCIVYHKDHGEVERHTINISQLQELDK